MAELQTITDIKNLRDSIRKRVRDINEFSSGNFGNESEYTHKGLIGGIEALLIDLSTLTKAKNKFIQISTYEERNKIITYLTKIEDYISQPSYFIQDFENLKLLIRSFGVRNFSERQIQFEEECANVLKLKIEIDDELRSIRKIKAKIAAEERKINNQIEIYNSKNKEIETKISNTNKSQTAVLEKLEEIKSNVIDLENTSTAIEEIEGSVNASFNNVKSNEKLIDSFAQKVQDREAKLDIIEKGVNDQKTKLEKYDTTRNEFLKQANELIESAKQALNYKTAEGISASFQTKLEQSSSKWRYFPWIIGGVVSILSAVALGIIILYTTTGTGLILGRLSLIPLPIIGAIFCARQYSKQKNIIEDYAYKMVLAKAIVGFSEHLKKNGSEDNSEYVHYIKTSLEEIHKDPLRKREKEKNSKEISLDGIIEMAEKLKKLTKFDNSNN